MASDQPNAGHLRRLVRLWRRSLGLCFHAASVAAIPRRYAAGPDPRKSCHVALLYSGANGSVLVSFGFLRGILASSTSSRRIGSLLFLPPCFNTASQSPATPFRFVTYRDSTSDTLPCLQTTFANLPAYFRKRIPQYKMLLKKLGS